MGLDMYLSAEMYVGNWDHNDDAEKARHKAILTACGLEGFRCDGAPALTVSVNVAYWRKANQIHGWFVSHVQSDVDNCQEYYVDREKLVELVAECEYALSNRDAADEVLPPHKGPFFGAYDMDEGYFADLEDTVKQLKAVLADSRFEHADFNYRSSW